MRLLRTLIIFLFFSLYLSGQKKPISFLHYNSLGLKYGQYFADENKFNPQPLTGIEEHLNSQINVWSLFLDHGRGKDGKVMYGEAGVSFYYLPSLDNDSLNMTWFGNSFYWNYKFDLFPKKEWIDVVGFVGPEFGSQRILVAKNTNREVYKNLFIGVVPGIGLRFQPGNKIAFGADASYHYDVSGRKWTHKFLFRKLSNSFELNNSGFTGYQFRVFVSVNL